MTNTMTKTLTSKLVKQGHIYCMQILFLDDEILRFSSTSKIDTCLQVEARCYTSMSRRTIGVLKIPFWNN